MEIDLENMDNSRLSSSQDYYLQQPHSEEYNRKQSMALSYKNKSDNDLSYYEYTNTNNNDNCCSLCKNTSKVFDYNTGEIICTICGMVIPDYMESVEPEWYTYSDRGVMEISKKVRTGRPISLALYDMGLSTQISYSNLD